MNSASTMAQSLSGELAEGQRKLIALATAGANASSINPLVTQLSNGPLGALHEKVYIFFLFFLLVSCISPIGPSLCIRDICIRLRFLWILQKNCQECYQKGNMRKLSPLLYREVM